MQITLHAVAFLCERYAWVARASIALLLQSWSAVFLEKQFNTPRAEIAPLLANIISLPHVVYDFKQAILEGLAFWQSNIGLDFADCYHLSLTEELGMTQIYSFDKKMDRYPGVERIEPEDE